MSGRRLSCEQGFDLVRQVDDVYRLGVKVIAARRVRFYRRLGFARVGRLPELVKPGRVEILLRKAAPPGIAPSARGPRGARER
jgi:hypothetical protein